VYFFEGACELRLCRGPVAILGHGSLQVGSSHSVEYAPLTTPGLHTLRVGVQGYGGPAHYRITLPSNVEFRSIATDFGPSRPLSGFEHSDVLDPFGPSGTGVHVYVVAAKP
jgi:hypothetical protein